MKIVIDSTSINLILKNAERIYDDAKILCDYKSYNTSFYLSIISQEESSKAFILILAKMEIIPWDEFIRQIIKNHICKQVIGDVIDYLEPNMDDFLNEKNRTIIPRKIKDLLNIFYHEKYRGMQSKRWIWAETPIYDKEAKQMSDGTIERSKQNSLYVNVGKTGMATIAKNINESTAEFELEKAGRFYKFIRDIHQEKITDRNKFENIINSIRYLFENK